MSKVLTWILGIGGVLLLVVLLAPLGVFFGWIVGHIIKFFCGDFVVNGLNLLCGSERFSPEMLPTIGGALGFVGAFFKSTSSSSGKK